MKNSDSSENYDVILKGSSSQKKYFKVLLENHPESLRYYIDKNKKIVIYIEKGEILNPAVKADIDAAAKILTSKGGSVEGHAGYRRIELLTGLKMKKLKDTLFKAKYEECKYKTLPNDIKGKILDNIQVGLGHVILGYEGLKYLQKSNKGKTLKMNF